MTTFSSSYIDEMINIGLQEVIKKESAVNEVNNQKDKETKALKEMIKTETDKIQTETLEAVSKTIQDAIDGKGNGVDLEMPPIQGI